MRVLILGASGIVGQHMRLCVPPGVTPTWVRRTEDPITRGVDLLADGQPEELLAEVDPDVVVNLAGESNVDTVESDPEKYECINIALPYVLARWCQARGKKLVHASSQAVYSGLHPPYSGMSEDPDAPVNAYGRQKRAADAAVRAHDGVIVRLSFILGIRPLPHVGRQNPLEAMLDGQSPQVSDRWFSPLMAWDAAEIMWDAVLNAKPGDVIQCGEPALYSRYGIAQLVNPAVVPCAHEDFPGLAKRPVNTTYTGSRFTFRVNAGSLREAQSDARNFDRANEIALFLGITQDQAAARLLQGFGRLHVAVADDFRRANPHTEAELLQWYRTTEAYIWELSAYHEDPGFNYSGMCAGIGTRLKNEGVRTVLCLGDGIGDLTLTLERFGLEPYYHDLEGSHTAAYADFRYWRQTGAEMRTHQSFMEDKRERMRNAYGAICSLDFLEHVPNVEEWVRAIFAALRPGGLGFFQNAFNCGSGPQGSIPMHLSSNDHWEKDWDPLLASVGFVQESSNWYRKP